MRNVIKAGLVALVLSASLALPAAAGPLEDGAAAAESGDYATAMRLLKPLADQGVAEAQYDLGLIYEGGLGVPQDYAEAVRWYRKAADQGIADAQYNLGLKYANGQGVPQDDAEAVRWYRKAADQGYAFAQSNLGFMYGKGRGIPQDYVQSYKWLNLAASRLSASEKERRDVVVENRDFIAAKMTPAQIAEAQKLAGEWRSK